MKQRKSNNFSVFVVVFSVFLFGVFMYNEDVKSIAEFPFSWPKSQDEMLTSTTTMTKAAVAVAPENESRVQESVKDDDDDDHVQDTAVSMTTITSLGEPQVLDRNQESQESEDDRLNSVGDQSKQEEGEEQREEEQDKQGSIGIREAEEDDEKSEYNEVELPPEECDLFTGTWVLDNETRPLYKEDECEFLTAQVTCMRNGRQDSRYQNWRWQPTHCSLPK